MNDVDMLKSNNPNVPMKPRAMAYMPNSISPIFEIIIGVNMNGNKNPMICERKW